MSIPIERASLADVPAVAALHVRAWRWAYRTLMPESLLAAQSVDARQAMWSRVLGDPATGTRLWIARTDDVVGIAAGGPPLEPVADPVQAEIYALYLDEHVAGTGLGRALFTALRDDLRAAGYRRAQLWVLTTNTRARDFYARAGFAPDGANRVELQHGVELAEVRYAGAL